jgi:hypothetical protein
MRHQKTPFLESRRQLLRGVALSVPLVTALAGVSGVRAAPKTSAGAEHDALAQALQRYGSEFGQIHHLQQGD